MKSLSLMRPLFMIFVIFGVIIDNNSVLAKQICRCVKEADDLDGIHAFAVAEEASKHCKGRFYCYYWLLIYYCEMTNDDCPEFEACCISFGHSINRTSCREISD